MRFSFIHAADLHIDSPFAGLGIKDPVVAERFARSGREAVEALMAEVIESKAAFLIIAGDVFDGDWKDVTTGLFFSRALGLLHRAGIPTFIVRGNHDAESVMSRNLPYPDSVYSFSSNKAESVALEQYQVTVHGRSFGGRKVPDDFVKSYPVRRDGWLNIGILHTGLDGTRGHESYAPCTIDDLRRFGYDYWALGHIHAGEVVSKEPWIVYPGNLQGRSVRETGPKGAVRVTVEDGRIVEVEPIFFDSARWVHETLDVSASHNEAQALDQIKVSLARLHTEAGRRPLAIRLSLTGTTAAHERLVAKQQWVEEEARAIGFQFAEDCWVEQVKLATSAPPRPPTHFAEPDAFDLNALLAAAAADPAIDIAVSELVASITEKLPRELRTEFTAHDPKAITDEARDYLLGNLS